MASRGVPSPGVPHAVADGDRRAEDRREADRYDGLLQLINQNHEQAEEGHTRLRGDYRDLKGTVDSNFRYFEDQTRLLRAELGAVQAQANTPLDATKLVLSTKAIIALTIAVVGIVGSYWNLSAKIDAQQRAVESQARLEQVQMDTLKSAADDAKATAADAKRQYELLRYDFQALKDTLSQKGR